MNDAKTKEKKLITKAKIIEAASGFFSTHNYHEVMMDDIAKEAGIAKGTLYNYFESKEGLYFTIMLDRMETLIASLKERINEASEPVESLKSFIIHNYMFMIKYSDFFLMYQKETLKAENGFCENIKIRQDELKSILEKIIRNGVKRKLFCGIDDSFAADIIIGMIHGGVKRCLDKKFSKEDLERERESLFNFALKSMNADMFGKPFDGKTIVIARTQEQGEESAGIFANMGADVIQIPTLEITEPTSWEPFDEAALNINLIDFLAFTSVNAVKMTLKRLDDINIKADFHKIKILAVGKKTAAFCKTQGLSVWLTPEEFSAEGVIKALETVEVSGKHFFIPASELSDGKLAGHLKERGAEVYQASVYNIGIPSESVIKKSLNILDDKKIDAYIFSSPSSYRNFLSIMNINDPRKYFNHGIIAAIGPATKNEIEKSGAVLQVVPKEYTMEGVSLALAEYFATGKI